MPDAFGRTTALLEADRFRASALTLLLSVGVGGAWAVWFTRAEVPLYEVTAAARLETNRAAYVIQSPIAGKLVASSLTVGRRVEADDEVARVESDPQKLERRESQTRVAAIETQIKALREELVLSEKAGEEERSTAQSGIEVTQSQVRSAEAPAKYLEAEIERLRKLRSEGLISERDYLRVISEATSQRATADSLRATINRLEREQRLRDSERRVRQQQVRNEITRLEGEQQTARSAQDRLTFEIARRVIRAPVRGVIGEAAILRPGAYIAEGQKLAAVVPEGATIVVAQYPPAAAIGRIRPGQTARIRLQGFPWMQYGSLHGVVERVAGEVRDGTVRVELSVKADAKSTIPIQHGLPGAVEIEVERVTPATLALRLAGRWVAAPREGRGGAVVESKQ